jgi:UDPglucose 6-dehydrogenase
LAAGATVAVYDPVAMTEAKRIFNGVKGISYAASPSEALNNAEALVIVTEWKEFRSQDFMQLKQKLKSNIIFDGRNIYDPAIVKKAGLEYRAIGRLTQ